MRLPTALPLALAALAALAALVLSQTPYRQCTRGDGPSVETAKTDLALTTCAFCAVSGNPCPENCCALTLTSASDGRPKQVLGCEVGGCCVRRVIIEDPDRPEEPEVMNVNERKTATGRSADGKCEGVKESGDECVACAWRSELPIGEDECAGSALNVPPETQEPVTPADVGCVDGSEVKGARGFDGAEGNVTASEEARKKEKKPVKASGKKDDDEKKKKKDDDAACFPASATVRLEGGVVKSMEDLRVGDRVLTSLGEYSQVFAFTHKLSTSQSYRSFIRLTTGSGSGGAGETETETETALLATAGHYIYLNGDLRAAGTALVGDVLSLGDGRTVPISTVSRVMARGLYNPQTLHGDIVVDGVVASTYTQAVDARLAHAALAGARAAFNWLGAYTTAFEGGSEIAAVLPQGGGVVA